MTFRASVDMPRGTGLRWQVAALLVALARRVGSVPITMRLDEGGMVPMQRMPVLKWARRCRIWLDGLDVTADAYDAYAPVLSGVEVPGKVWFYKRNVGGHRYLEGAGDSREPAREVRCGMVRWEPVPTRVARGEE